MKDVIKNGEQLLEWAIQHQAVFLVLFIIVCYFFWKAQSKNIELFEKELEESKQERKEILLEHKQEREKFLSALAEQQKLTDKQHVLIDKQYTLLKSEKEQIDRIENKMDTVEHKLDMVLVRGKES
ncbi:Gp23 family protein [Enterococcus hirae]